MRIHLTRFCTLQGALASTRCQINRNNNSWLVDQNQFVTHCSRSKPLAVRQMGILPTHYEQCQWSCNQFLSDVKSTFPKIPFERLPTYLARGKRLASCSTLCLIGTQALRWLLLIRKPWGKKKISLVDLFGARTIQRTNCDTFFLYKWKSKF